MLPLETFEMRNRFLTSPLAKPKYNTKEILRTYELFVDYVTNSFCNTVLKWQHVNQGDKLNFYC